MNLNIYILSGLLLFFCNCKAQDYPLKSVTHGLNMMLLDIPKEELLEEIRFEDGFNDSINVIRFDHVGPNLFPLLISSKLPVPTDSLGILSFKLQKDSLHKFLETIDNVTPKIYSRKLDFVLIRVTYRFNGYSEQYYITNARIATGFLKIIEDMLIVNGDNEALNKFYLFISRMKLRKSVHGKWVWKY